MGNESNLENNPAKVPVTVAAVDLAPDVRDELKDLLSETMDEMPDGEVLDESPEEDIEETLGDDELEVGEDESVASGKKNSKAESKIVEQKRLLKKQEARIKELEAANEQKKAETAIAKLKDSYVKNGYDEDVALDMAKTAHEQSAQRRELDIMKFERVNRRELAKYANSDKDLDEIFDVCAKTGWTVDRVCRGMYGTTVPSTEKRAEEALTGKLARNSATDAASVTSRAGKAGKVVALTQLDLVYKARLEKIIGDKLTNEHYLELRKSME